MTRLTRSRSAIMRLKPRIVAVGKELRVPELSSGATASYGAENAAIAVSEPTFAEDVKRRPRR